MKSGALTWKTATTLFAALAIPIRLPAQVQNKGHHRYKLVDIGTFGGPESNINQAFSLGAPNQINKRGTAVGGSATSIPSPPNSNLTYCGGLDGMVPFVFHAFQWQDGTVTDLGALPGTDTCSVATSINARGEIVGSSENGLFDPLVGIRQIRAVLWKDGKIKDLGAFGGNESLAGSINDIGQVVGTALNAIPDPFSLFFFAGTQARAFLWQDGDMQDLGTLGGPDAQAYFVNERGQVIGLSYTNSTPNPTTNIPTADPFLWTRDRGMIDLGTLGGAIGLATLLNNRGQVVGNSSLAADPGACFGIGNPANCHPFLWDDGNLLDLTAQSGGLIVTANAINDAGEIVGLECLPSGTCDAYLWRNGTITDLGVLPGDCYSQAFAINSGGQVVGQSYNCVSNTARTFLWENGSMIDLNDFVPPGSGLRLVEAAAINDRGEIAGDLVPPGCSADDKCGHAFVLVPVGEDDTAGITAVTQNYSAATVTPGSPAAMEMMARVHARLARRYRDFRAGPRN